MYHLHALPRGADNELMMEDQYGVRARVSNCLEFNYLRFGMEPDALMGLINTKYLFIHFIMRLAHTESFIRFLSGDILFLYVEQAATYLGMIFREF